ncbi:MAG: arylsulfotransferase family protein [Haloarculaceae archaeon]
MDRRHAVRAVLLVAVLGSAGVLGAGWADAGRDVAAIADGATDRPFADRRPVAPPREGTTVITTDPPGGRGNATAALVALAPDGRVRYYDDTYDNYFDVDPDPPGSRTVLYVAGSRFDPCPPDLAERAPEDVDTDGGCGLVAVDRTNLSTGATTRLHTAVTAWDLWHDVDRVGDARLLVADIARDRVAVVNTTTDAVEWAWDAEEDLRASSGGRAGDWTHLNDVERLPDGRVMVGLRNQDRVAFLDPGRGLIDGWTLGGEDDYGVLYEQHNPDYIPEERGGPAIVVADSENNRVVEYRREGGEWRRTWAWRDDRLRWPRDADRLPGGHTLVTDSQGNRVIEVDERGGVVWQVTIGTPYEAERLGTGDESATGRARRPSGTGTLGGSGDDGHGGASGQAGPLGRAVAFLAGPAVNGFLYAAPAWVTVGDLPALALLLGSLVAWGLAELRWSWGRVRTAVAGRWW